MRTVVASDIHLGSPLAHPARFLNFLNKAQFDLLIIAGDLVDKAKNGTFDLTSWAVLRKLRDLVAEHRLVFVDGNHDRAAYGETPVAHYLGCNVVHRHFVYYDSARYLVAHGDIYDRHLGRYNSLSLADTAYKLSRHVHEDLPGHLKRWAKKYLHVVPEVEKYACRDAQGSKAAGVVVGHTHFPADVRRSDGIHYLNSGCWTDGEASYVLFEPGTGPRLMHWHVV